MGCTIVVGGQYGSEGKGKVVALETARRACPWVVRCGGPNSGHTVDVNGRPVVLRQVGAGIRHPEARLLLAAGCVVDETILASEIAELALPRERIIVDPRAVLVTDADKEAERPSVDTIGSTASGTGAALMRRISRRPDVLLAGESKQLAEIARVESVAPLLHDQFQHGADVIIEGTQGFGLSLLHGTGYPFVTAKDTTAAAFISEAGISPLDVTEIVLVIRTFPIRVGGNSGQLAAETDWKEIQRISGAPSIAPEYTSVTKRLRRVGYFDMEPVKAACRYNRPTSIAVMGLDRLEHRNYGVRHAADLTERATTFIQWLENDTKVPVRWAGTGFGTDDVVRFDTTSIPSSRLMTPSQASARRVRPPANAETLVR